MVLVLLAAAMLVSLGLAVFIEERLAKNGSQIRTREAEELRAAYDRALSTGTWPDELPAITNSSADRAERARTRQAA